MADATDSRAIGFELRDMCDGSLPAKKGIVEILPGNAGIFLRFDGYGDKCSQDGKGVPVIVEYNQGKVRVLIWNDINREDMTHAIDLEGAREDLRIEE